MAGRSPVGEAGGTLTALEAPTAPSLAEEAEVVQRLRSGDRGALATLYGWYGDRLYRQVILPRLPRIDLAEDVLRDTFRLAVEHITRYEPQNVSIYVWLRRIAINRAMDVHRADGRDRRLREAAAREPERTYGTPPPPPDRAVDTAELCDRVRASLGTLHDRYAQALRLRLLEDRDREECAAVMGVTVGNFDVILHRACKAFRQVWDP
ncbi:MAG: RNA polymerase sigma factor [Deltaproteobacteria bacterium]|nr:RNA polymerase sigma factor [Deltaproteobacteria bacterium]